VKATLKPCPIPAFLRRSRQFKMGRKVEREHTTSQRVADCITFHHLAEEAAARKIPLWSVRLRYYTDLSATERSWKRRR